MRDSAETLLETGAVDLLPVDNEVPTDDNFQRSTLRTVVVTHREQESDSVLSFTLSPDDGAAIPYFRPGQFLTFELEIPGQERRVIRTYTISDCWRERCYRISVKRERAARPHLPDGLSSNYFHDVVMLGAKLRILGPRGRFFLDEASERPIVLLSGGIGVTPMISMLNAVVAEDRCRAVWFIHGCRNSAEHAFADHVRRLVGEYSNVAAHVCYSRPLPGDVQGRDFNELGHVGTDVLRHVLPFDSYDFYLCGPPPFMESLYEGLRALDVPPHRIRYEFFSPSVAPQPSVVMEGKSDFPSTSQNEQPMVHFVRSGASARWDPSCESLLEFAEMQGLTPNFGCRSGICETCICRLVAGDVEYVTEPLESPPKGQALICCSKPRTDLKLDI